MSEKNIGNQKAKRSKVKISEALVQLMHDKHFDDITILELTDQAGLSRRTFYRNYSSKEDIVIDFFIDIWKEYIGKIDLLEEKSLYNIALTFFRVIQDHQDLLEIFNNNDLFIIFLKESPTLLKEDYGRRNIKNVNISKGAYDYIPYFITSGFFQVAKVWFDRGKKEDPEDLAGYIAAIKYIY